MIDIEPKGLDLPKRELPTELKPVEEKFKKPEITIDIFSRLGYWAESKLVDVAAKIITKAVPYWVWLALIGAVVVAIIVISLIRSS